MAQKNRHLFRGRISERKFRDLLRLFALDITADRAAGLTGLHHNTTLALYRLLRGRMAELAQADCPFRGQVEIDESYFGPAHTRGHRGRGSPCKVPVFGIFGVVAMKVDRPSKGDRNRQPWFKLRYEWKRQVLENQDLSSGARNLAVILCE